MVTCIGVTVHVVGWTAPAIGRHARTVHNTFGTDQPWDFQDARFSQLTDHCLSLPCMPFPLPHRGGNLDGSDAKSISPLSLWDAFFSVVAAAEVPEKALATEQEAASFARRPSLARPHKPLAIPFSQTPLLHSSGRQDPEP